MYREIEPSNPAVEGSITRIGINGVVHGQNVVIPEDFLFFIGIQLENLPMKEDQRLFPQNNQKSIAEFGNLAHYEEPCPPAAAPVKVVSQICVGRCKSVFFIRYFYFSFQSSLANILDVLPTKYRQSKTF